MKEKRKFPRIDNDKVKVMWRKVEKLDSLDDIKNISEGGICLKIKHDDIHKNDILSLSIALPNKDLIFCKANVVWVKQLDKTDLNKNKYLIGVEFINIDSQSREKIKELVQKSF